MPARPDHHPLAHLARPDRVPPGLARRVIAPRPASPPLVPAPATGTERAPDPARRPRARGPVRLSPRAADLPRAVAPPRPGDQPGIADQDGSVATEYGLLAVVAATIVSVMLEWATGGGITSLLQAVMGRVTEVVGL